MRKRHSRAGTSVEVTLICAWYVPGGHVIDSLAAITVTNDAELVVPATVPVAPLSARSRFGTAATLQVRTRFVVRSERVSGGGGVGGFGLVMQLGGDR